MTRCNYPDCRKDALWYCPNGMVILGPYCERHTQMAEFNKVLKVKARVAIDLIDEIRI